MRDRIDLDDQGRIDDVVIHGDAVHFERMDEHWFWLAVYRGEKRIAFNFHAKPDGTIAVVGMDDELGLLPGA